MHLPTGQKREKISKLLVSPLLAVLLLGLLRMRVTN